MRVTVSSRRRLFPSVGVGLPSYIKACEHPEEWREPQVIPTLLADVVAPDPLHDWCALCGTTLKTTVKTREAA